MTDAGGGPSPAIPAATGAAGEVPPEEGRTVVVLGDSFTAGEGDPTGVGWVGPVVAVARRTLPAATTAYPLGVCGDAIADVETRWRHELEARSRTRTVTHVLLAIGTNDAWALREAGARADGPVAAAATASLERTLDALEGLGVPLGIVGIPPLPEHVADGLGAALDGRWAGVAAVRGLRRFDLREPLGADDRWARALRAAPDGIHPDAEGYAAWADALLAQGLVDWLGRTGGGPRRRTPSAAAAG